MNIIITLAGHSRRFKQAGYTVPKAFIEIDGRPMIAHVTDMFGRDDKYFYVVNEEQVRENPGIVKLLKSLATRTEVVVVPVHEKGPVYSAMQIAGIPDDEEVIVTYCDFIVDWDYPRFLRHARSYDASIPAFKGFHPASFGNTYYAYMRVDGEQMLELREKRSFTEDRTQEPASSGIYYFRNWEIFRKYSEQLLAMDKKELPEAYVSLLANLLVADGLTVGVPDVERFICWGTPEDLEHYLLWLKYFRALDRGLETHELSQDGKKRINLLPMAGKGSRFKTEGYRVTKPLIQVNKKPMVVAAAESFPAADRWIFLVRDTELQKHPIEASLRRYYSDCHVVSVDHDTSGQAATCLLAESLLDSEAELFIASCDYQNIFQSKNWQKILDDPSIDGAIWTYRLGSQLTKNPNAFAYCQTAEDGLAVTRVVEKKTISDQPGKDPMVVGSFWYRRSSDFVRGAKKMIERGITVNGEHYVGTSINTLIEEGRKFVIFDIDQWISFGDPFELRVFEYWQDHFFKKFNDSHL